ncbi:hypothetical protein ACX53_00305 [Loigolactobacillus backii]|nr:hypothetical protein ACX53_00305 [Loigolactobacillus backii]
MAFENGGHVVTLIEEPEKVVLTKEQAEIVEDAHVKGFPATFIYDAALPDDLPVIPKEVEEILQSAYGQTNLLGVLDTAKNGYKFSETLAWIIEYQRTFARAWVLGVWRVEETGEIVKLEEEK